MCEEYYQTSPNKNKSPYLCHIISILVCCIFAYCCSPGNHTAESGHLHNNKPAPNLLLFTSTCRSRAVTIQVRPLAVLPKFSRKALAQKYMGQFKKVIRHSMKGIMKYCHEVSAMLRTGELWLLFAKQGCVTSKTGLLSTLAQFIILILSY